MSHVSLILTGLMLLAMTIYIAPGIFAMSRGNTLRNVALWLAIFLALSLFYKNFGPESAHPLFAMPDSMAGMNRGEAIIKLPPADKAEEKKPEPETGATGYTPPKD